MHQKAVRTWRHISVYNWQ